MSDPPHIRVSDEQREHAAQSLRDHFAAGRLSEEEFDQRVQAAYRARTASELEALAADLPLLPVTRERQKAELAARRRELQRRLLQQSGGGLALLAVCTVIWLVNGAQGRFWPVWVLVVVLIPLVRNGWRLYGPAPELDRVERELELRERQERRRAARRTRRSRR